MGKHKWLHFLAISCVPIIQENSRRKWKLKLKDPSRYTVIRRLHDLDKKSGPDERDRLSVNVDNSLFIRSAVLIDTTDFPTLLKSIEDEETNYDSGL